MELVMQEVGGGESVQKPGNGRCTDALWRGVSTEAGK